MAGVKTNTYGSGNNLLDNLMTSTDTQRRGYNAVSLTEWTNTTTIPKIASGSVLEIGGSIVEFQADETITGSLTTGDNYISINSNTYVASWTTTPPVWDSEKQGFYAGTNRILNFRVNKNGSIYTKYDIAFKNNNLSVGGNLEVCGITNSLVKINQFHNIDATLVTRGTLYSTFSYLPIDIILKCAGCLSVGSPPKYLELYGIERTSSYIYLYWSVFGLQANFTRFGAVGSSALLSDISDPNFYSPLVLVIGL